MKLDYIKIDNISLLRPIIFWQVFHGNKYTCSIQQDKYLKAPNYKVNRRGVVSEEKVFDTFEETKVYIEDTYLISLV